MKLNKFSLVILVLFATTNRGEIVVGTKSLNTSISRLFEDLANIVTSCYGDRNNGVALIGNFSDTFIRTLMVQHSIPVAVMSNTWNFSRRDLGGFHAPVQFQHKLHVFIVEASSARELYIAIKRNRYFIWWNHMASFFILDLSPRCTNYGRYLHAAWRRNILNVKVICRSTAEKTVIITCNPFTSQAPAIWHRLKVLLSDTRILNKNRPFFTFFREYRENKEICVNLDFDKSKDLGGHEIFIESYNDNEFITQFQNYKAAYNFCITQKRIFSIIAHALNGTPMASNYEDPNEDTRMHPVWVGNGIWDSFLITYPHEQIGFVLASQFRGHKSQLNKILTVVDFNSRIGMGIVYLITLISLKFFVHQTFVPAMLNLMRITCNTGFTNLPDNNATRIFFTGLLFFVVTMQGIYQGNLASLLTTTIPLRDIETMQDVVDFGYKIYGRSDFITIVDDPNLRERYIGVDRKACITRVTNDPLAVCLMIPTGINLDRLRKFSLHTSSKFIHHIYIGFQLKWDLPFEHQVNIIIRKLVEADALQPWNLKCAQTELTEFQFDEQVKKNVVFKNIELGELTFAFVILAIGLVCATITYIAEVAIYSHKHRIVNVRVRRLN